MTQLKIGDRFESTLIVEEKHTAAAFGSGSIFVFSTPMMIGLMENAALMCAQAKLESPYSTVGTFVDVKHIAATPMGQKVSAIAELIEMDQKNCCLKLKPLMRTKKSGKVCMVDISLIQLNF